MRLRKQVGKTVVTKDVSLVTLIHSAKTSDELLKLRRMADMHTSMSTKTKKRVAAAMAAMERKLTPLLEGPINSPAPAPTEGQVPS